MKKISVYLLLHRPDWIVLVTPLIATLVFLFSLSIFLENSALAGRPGITNRDNRTNSNPDDLAGPLPAATLSEKLAAGRSGEGAASGDWHIASTDPAANARQGGDRMLAESGLKGLSAAETGTVVAILLTIIAGLVVISWRTRRYRARKTDESGRNERRLAGLLDVASDAIISVDADQRITLFNRGAAQAFGYEPSEILGRPLDQLIPDRFHAAHRGHIANFLASADISRLKNRRNELVGLRKDGSEFPAEASISKLRLDDGTMFTVMLRDITERKRAEEALRESEERLSQIFRTSPALIFVSEQETGVTLDVNPAAMLALGYAYEEIVGKTSLELGIWPDEKDRMVILERLERDGFVRNFESELCAKDGKRIPFLFSINRIDIDGKECLLSMLVDITERKRSEQALRESEERLHAIVDNSPTAIVVKDRKGRFLLANKVQRQCRDQRKWSSFSIEKNNHIARSICG